MAETDKVAVISFVEAEEDEEVCLEEEEEDIFLEEELDAFLVVRRARREERWVRKTHVKNNTLLI